MTAEVLRLCGRTFFGNRPGKRTGSFREKRRYLFLYLDTKDEVKVGDSEPDVEGVIGSTLYYKGFSFSVHLRYSLGGDVFNKALYSKVENISETNLKYNQDKRALYDRWEKPGQHARFKKISLTETTPCLPVLSKRRFFERRIFFCRI